jgi:hypothetical protein
MEFEEKGRDMRFKRCGGDWELGYERQKKRDWRILMALSRYLLRC